MTDKLDIYIGRLQHLPAAPTVVVKLVALFRKHNLEVDEIVSLMSQDPSLTAEVLRSANSAYFGDDDQVVGVFEAIMRLGLYKVYQMAMANFGATVLSFSRNVGGIDVETLWRHSAAVASAAGLIARKVEEPEALAFTAGLLHDVGKIVLGAAEGTAYAALAREAVETGVPLQQAEAKRFGFGHAEVGARLLAKWGLPEEIAVPVRDDRGRPGLDEGRAVPEEEEQDDADLQDEPDRAGHPGERRHAERRHPAADAGIDMQPDPARCR